VIRGAVYPVDLGDAKRGHEQRGRRLALVISMEQNAWSTVTIIPTSTSAQPAVFRPEVVIAGRDTKILVDQVRTIDTCYVAGELLDYLSRDDMAQVEHSLSRYLGLLHLQGFRQQLDDPSPVSPGTAWRVQARPVPAARGAGQAAGSDGSEGAVRQMT
jgi:mRNA interferase MazF